MDVHSYSRPGEARVRRLHLDLELDFDRHELRGTAELHFDRKPGAELILDTRDLRIDAVDKAVHWELGPPDPILGAPLRIVPGDSDSVCVRYATSPAASGLQWLEPGQTAGKRLPFLYTQSQAIHARSWIPLQDSPGVRVTFSANVKAPPGVQVCMGAERLRDGHFRMEQPIPSYLIALAAGDLHFRELGPRSGVYAEPPLIDAAAYEFGDTEAMIGAVEQLYGPYRWGRYDVLVLPPSFPFGGMENPRLTFATPSILTGDRSLVSLVAHELAHSWSGNLVTNATWNDFWLNEGFTVYVERRILEKVYGRDRAEMEAMLGRGELDRAMEDLPECDRVLQQDLAGRDPDEGCTQVPYEKGALLLRTIERAVGRQRFDVWLRGYFDRFAFQSITTAQFLDDLRNHLPEAPDIGAWMRTPAIPEGAAEPESDALARAERAESDSAKWSTHEWLHYLRTRRDPDMAALDREFRFTQSRNSEILAEWLLMAVRAGYQPAYPRLEEFLSGTGRRKFIRPLYAELLKTPEGRQRAEAIYARARAGYHPIAQATIDTLMKT